CGEIWFGSAGGGFGSRGYRQLFGERAARFGAECLRVNVEPVVFLGWQRQQRLAERALDHLQLIAACTLFFRSTLLVDALAQPYLERAYAFPQCCIGRVADHPRPGAWRELDKGRIDVALQVSKRPRWPREVVDLDQILDDPRASPEQGDAIGVRWFVD